LYFVLVVTKFVHTEIGHCRIYFILYFKGLKLIILHITMIDFNINQFCND